MFENQTPEAIKARVLASINQSQGVSPMAGGFADGVVGPFSEEQSKVYLSLDAVPSMVYVDEYSGGYIDLRCAEYGITRKAGTRARAAVTLTGAAGTVVPAGTVFLTAGGLEFGLLEGVELGADGTAAGTVEAAREGAAYNIEAGALTRMYVNLQGLDRYTNGAAEGGTDAESDAALCRRFYDYLQKPATSGNVYHYERWALEVDGVGACRVTPLWDGPGTVKVLIVDANREPATAEIVTACAAHIEEQRPIGATVTVKSAEGLRVDVSAEVSIDPSTTLEAVRAAFEANLDAYVKELAFESYTLLYNRIAYLLLSVPGVRDFAALTVNGGTASIAIGAEQVPVLGTVSVA